MEEANIDFRLFLILLVNQRFFQFLELLQDDLLRFQLVFTQDSVRVVPPHLGLNKDLIEVAEVDWKCIMCEFSITWVFVYRRFRFFPDSDLLFPLSYFSENTFLW